MNQLSKIDLQILVTQGIPLPEMEIVSKWIDLITCRICFAFKPNIMVIHRNCMRLFCASCIDSLMGTAPSPQCGWCRGDIYEITDEVFNTTFYTPPPNDVWLFDNLEFKCEHCNQTFQMLEAKSHYNRCDKNPRFKPPSYIHDWTSVPLVRRATVSNPIQIGPSPTKDRLIIFHHNGNQIGSYFLNSEWPITRVKQYIARRANIDANILAIYKFFHVKLDDDDILGDIAPGTGSTHLTSITDLPDFADRTALILLEDAGPQPRVHRPVARRSARGLAVF